MHRTRVNNFMKRNRIFLIFLLVQQCQSITVATSTADHGNGVHIHYVKAFSGRNNDVKLLEVGGRGLKAIKNLRASNQSDNCGDVDKELHRLESHDHYILASLTNKIQKNSWNYLCYESMDDGTWKHLGMVGKFYR